MFTLKYVFQITALVRRKNLLFAKSILLGFVILLSSSAQGQEEEKDRLVFLELGGQSPYYSINYNVKKFEVQKKVWIMSVGLGYLGIDNRKQDFLLDEDANYFTLNYKNELHYGIREGGKTFLNYGIAITIPIETRFGNNPISDSFFSASVGISYIGEKALFALKYSPIIATQIYEEFFDSDPADVIQLTHWPGFTLGFRL